MTAYPPLRRRQVHLDFHTSEHIPNVGAEFDADDFVRTLRDACVDSITLFAKCHHGWSYYPTQAGRSHPTLVRPDLLGEMVTACRAADIETPIYLSVQWDERVAREHPEWRAMSATNSLAFVDPTERSALGQLSAAWHTICLTHRPYMEELKAQTSEIIALYKPPGVFFDILQPPDCVCPNCLDRMLANGLDPLLPADRLKNDYAVLEEVRSELSAHVDATMPGTRIFYNSGHIAKHGKDAYRAYSHLELESLPTGGWGYDHFPASARYADYLGFDFLGHTGKFHTSWGDFGGFKHPDALVYETAQMAALGAKCLVGDQLHPSGRMNRATYATIAPAYDRIRRLGPLLEGAQYQSEIAILASEYFHRERDGKNHAVDDGAVRMLLESHRGFDIIDPDASFGNYRLIILPDNIPVDAELGQRLAAFVKDGGKILLSGTSGIDPLTGRFSVDAGITYLGKNTFETSYVAADGLKKLPDVPFVVYCPSGRVSVQTAEVLAELRDPYFDRTYAHFCSHQHAPDNPYAASPGPAATVSGGIGYIALPIFGAYHDAGQPYYRYLVDAVINRLLPDPLVVTDLPSAARVSLTKSGEDYVLHLMHGTPQVRGRSVKLPARHHRQAIEIIEDIPVLGPSHTSIRLEGEWSAHDGLSGEQFFARSCDGRLEVDVPSLHIHRAVVLTRGTVSEPILSFERLHDEQGR